MGRCKDFPAPRTERGAGLIYDDGAPGHMWERAACRVETLYALVAHANDESAIRRFTGRPDRILVANSANVAIVRIYDDLGNVRATHVVGAGVTVALEIKHRGVTIESLTDGAAGTMTITGLFDTRPPMPAPRRYEA